MTELRQRRPRQLDPGFLDFIRGKPCCVCGAVGRTQAAHIRMGNALLGAESTGMGERPSDWRATPLCGPVLGAFPPITGCHAEQHSMSEQAFWSRHGLQPYLIAIDLWRAYANTRPETAADEPATPRPRKPKVRRKPNYRPPGRGAWPKTQRKLQGRGFTKGKRKFRP